MNEDLFKNKGRENSIIKSLCMCVHGLKSCCSLLLLSHIFSVQFSKRLFFLIKELIMLLTPYVFTNIRLHKYNVYNIYINISFTKKKKNAFSHIWEHVDLYTVHLSTGLHRQLMDSCINKNQYNISIFNMSTTKYWHTVLVIVFDSSNMF